jgi:hypothetical protein
MFSFKRTDNINGRTDSASKSATHSMNLVREVGIIEPRYAQDLSHRRVIDFIYLPEDRVMLLGSMDGQYPYWVSVTDISDTRTNEDILNRILFDDFNEFAGTFSSPGLSVSVNDRYRRRYSVTDGIISTPFEYGMSSESGQRKYWGKMISQGILSHYRQMKELCRYRELDGRYLSFLEDYLAQIKERTSKDDVKNYEDKQMLIKLIQSEDYLYLSEDPDIRNTYIKIRNEIGKIYNRYMSIVR